MTGILFYSSFISDLANKVFLVITASLITASLGILMNLHNSKRTGIFNYESNVGEFDEEITASGSTGE